MACVYLKCFHLTLALSKSVSNIQLLKGNIFQRTFITKEDADDSRGVGNINVAHLYIADSILIKKANAYDP